MQSGILYSDTVVKACVDILVFVHGLCLYNALTAYGKKSCKVLNQSHYIKRYVSLKVYKRFLLAT
jgi:hypothetical protein